MRPIIVALLLLLIAPEALADPPPWAGTTVPIHDYTSSDWDGIFGATVGQFNAMLAPGGPRLVYRRMSPTPCDAITTPKPKKWRGIVVCSSGTPLPNNFAGYTTWDVGWGQRQGLVLRRVQIALTFPVTGSQHNLACHELMHAVTGIPDNYGAAPDTSCVWGDLPSPGSFDVAHAKQVYEGKKPNDKAKRREHRKRHH